MLDNQSWQDASAKLIEDPQVQDALSVYLVNQLYDKVDVSSALGETSHRAQVVAPSVAAGCGSPPPTASSACSRRRAFQQSWVNANAVATRSSSTCSRTRRRRITTATGTSRWT